MHILNNEVILEVTLLCKKVLRLEPDTSNWTNHIVCREVKFLLACDLLFRVVQMNIVRSVQAFVLVASTESLLCY